MTTPDPTRWHVVIPVKARARSKTRLGADARRMRLALAFAIDTMAAVRQCPSVAGLVVVTDDPGVAEAATRAGAIVVAEQDDAAVRGFARLNAAIMHGVTTAGLQTFPVAALTADLPALKPDELTRALRQAEQHARAFVPDHEGLGTAMLTAVTGTALKPRFGLSSAAAHEASGATRLDLPDTPGLRLDVDWQHDLHAAVDLRCGPATRAALEPDAVPLLGE